jgi:hypothetical protein
MCNVPTNPIPLALLRRAWRHDSPWPWAAAHGHEYMALGGLASRYSLTDPPAPRHGRVRLDRSRWPSSRHGRISSSAWQGRSSLQRFVPAPPSPARAALQSHRGPRSRGASSSASAPPSSTRSPAWPPAAPRPALSLPERGRGKGFPQSSRFLGAAFFRKYRYKAVLFFCFRTWLMEIYCRFWRMWSGPTSSLSSLRTSAASTSK